MVDHEQDLDEGDIFTLDSGDGLTPLQSSSSQDHVPQLPLNNNTNPSPLNSSPQSQLPESNQHNESERSYLDDPAVNGQENEKSSVSGNVPSFPPVRLGASVSLLSMSSATSGSTDQSLTPCTSANTSQDRLFTLSTTADHMSSTTDTENIARNNNVNPNTYSNDTFPFVIRVFNGFNVTRDVFIPPSPKVISRKRGIHNFLGFISFIPAVFVLWVLSSKHIMAFCQSCPSSQSCTLPPFHSFSLPLFPSWLFSSVAFMLGVCGASAYGLQSMSVLWSRDVIIYFIGYTLLTWLYTISVSLGYFPIQSMYTTFIISIYSLIFLYFWFISIKKLYVSHAPPAAPFKNFLIWSYFQTLTIVFVLFIYDFGIFQWFYISPIWLQYFIRIVIHTLLAELSTINYRIYTLYLNDNFKSFSNHPLLLYWYYFPMFSQLFFSILGRFLVASMPTLYASIGISAVLALMDTVSRSTIIIRDTYYLRFLRFLVVKCIPNSFHRLSSDLLEVLDSISHPHAILVNRSSYASWYLADSISELGSIFLGPFIISFYNLSAGRDILPNSTSNLIILTFTSLLFEIFAESWRAAHFTKQPLPHYSYINISGYREIIPTTLNPPAIINPANIGSQSFSIFWTSWRAKWILYWKCLEVAIHDECKQTSKWFFILNCWISICIVLHIYQTFFIKHICADIVPNRILKQTYFC